MSRGPELQDSQDSVKIVTDPQHLRSDSKPEVYTTGIYVKNHDAQNQECFIWIRFDHSKLGEKVSLPLLREDLLISETWPLEQRDSHNLLILPKTDYFRNKWFWCPMVLHNISKVLRCV